MVTPQRGIKPSAQGRATEERHPGYGRQPEWSPLEGAKAGKQRTH